MKCSIKILAIETSCDETAAAVIGMENNKPVILSNIVSSQVDLHAKTGGVVPEVASRAHVEAIVPVIEKALNEARLLCHSERSEESISNVALDPSALPQDDKGKYSNIINYLQNEIDYIAVTAGPGLIGSLLVGFNAAKTLSYSLKKPIIPINHIEGHIYSAFSREIRPVSPGASRGGNPKSEILNKSQYSKKENSKYVSSFELRASNFPLIALTVSGGHTSLTLMKDHGKYETLGETLDDAAGEAFDKVAQLLDLGYPGGPVVSKLASEFRNKQRPLKFVIPAPMVYRGKHPAGIQKNTILDPRVKPEDDKEGLVFPRPILNDGTFNFSFSGLKTAVLQYVLNIKKINGDTSLREMSPTDNLLSKGEKAEICAAFEEAVVEVLVTKTVRAAEKYRPKAIILAGGVAANEFLRNSLVSSIKYQVSGIKFLPAPMNLTGDNAAMIGLAAFYHIKKGNISSWDKVEVDSNIQLGKRVGL